MKKPIRTIRWDITGSLGQAKPSTEAIIGVLLNNRGLQTEDEKRDFFTPPDPLELPLIDFGIDGKEIKKAIERIKEALKNSEQVVVYGDYDADGVTATAILWECLHAAGLSVMPHIPERFSEGYGVNKESIDALIKKYPKLGVIVSVDNGIVAFAAAEHAKKQGLDLIITDHHQPGEKFPVAHSVIHTTAIGGAGVSWVFARELAKTLGVAEKKYSPREALALTAIGTIADQLPLLSVNRTLVKHGLSELARTKRAGLVALCRDAGIDPVNVGTYDINFGIAPRLNAAGRMNHAIESLRLLCTKDIARAEELARLLAKTNRDRQVVVEEIVDHAKSAVDESELSSVVVVADVSYHEGVIGLAASALVEEFYRPSIVLAKGEEVSKASARSIAGFDIIQNIRAIEELIIEGGGHPMAAGFSIKNENIEEFVKRINELAAPLLTEEILARKLRVDLEVPFESLTWELAEKLSEFVPTGIGNPNPTLVSTDVEVLEARVVGAEGKHAKLKVRQGDSTIDAIAFKMGWLVNELAEGTLVDLAYNFEKNVWNGNESLQLKLRDIRIKNYEET